MTLTYEIGTGRLVPGVAALVALASVIAGGLALRRAHRTGALIALIAGPVSAFIGGLHAANAAGGLGTGNGLAGAVLALVLGLAGTAAGGLALVRLRTT